MTGRGCVLAAKLGGTGNDTLAARRQEERTEKRDM